MLTIKKWNAKMKWKYFPKKERSVKREERYFKQQGNIEFFRRAENADIF